MAEADDERTPLHLAAIKGKYEVVEVCILLSYFRCFSFRLLQLLIAEGVFLDAANVFGNTPLHYAATYGWRETAKVSERLYFIVRWCIQVLVKAGASKTVTNKSGRTPFDLVCLLSDYACSKSKRSSLERLLRP